MNVNFESLKGRMEKNFVVEDGVYTISNGKNSKVVKMRLLECPEYGKCNAQYMDQYNNIYIDLNYDSDELIALGEYIKREYLGQQGNLLIIDNELEKLTGESIFRSDELNEKYEKDNSIFISYYYLDDLFVEYEIIENNDDKTKIVVEVGTIVG